MKKLLQWLCCLLPLTAFAQPNVNLGPDATICGTTFNLNAGNAGATFLWNTGATTSTITATASGMYWVDVTDGTGTSRDSIELRFNPPPVVGYLPADTSLCQGNQWLSTNTSSGVLQWLDSTFQVLTVGDSLLYNVQDTTQLYYRAVYVSNLPTFVGASLGTTATGFVGLDRGIVFNVLELVQLNSVQLSIDNGPFTAQLVVEDAQGQTVYSGSVNLPSAGVHTVNIGVLLAPANGYRIFLRNISGGNARFNNPISNWSIYNTPQIQLVGGVPFASVYAYFYEWDIAAFDTNCSSGLDSIRINSLSTPVLDLGPDTTLCSDSLLLDASSSGATLYIWNTSVNASQIAVFNDGTYSVTASQNGLCAVSDSIDIKLQQPPFFINRPVNQTNCQGLATLVAQANNGIVQWLDSSQALLAIGDTFQYNAFNTSQFYYRAGYWKDAPNTIGRDFPSSGGVSFNQDRGIEFDVLEFMRLDGVQINIDQVPFTAVVAIEDAQGQLIYTQAVNFNTSGIQTIHLGGTVLSPAAGYRILLRNISRGSAVLESGVTNWTPYQNGTLRLTAGAPFALVYGYFYNWSYATLSNLCASGLDSVRVDILPVPTVRLGTDTTLCNATLSLDAGAGTGNTTYRWSTGSTTRTLGVTTTGRYSVTVTESGLCQDSASRYVEIVTPPNILQHPNDRVVCASDIQLIAASDTGVVRWMDVQGMTFELGDTLHYAAIDSTFLYYQAGYWQAFGTSVGRDFPTGGGRYFGQDRGIEFDVLDFMRLDRVQIKIDQAPFTAVVVIEDAQGQVVYNQSIGFNTTGVQTINLGAILAPATGYRILLRNISGGNALLETGVTNWTPYQNTHLRLVAGTPFSVVYGYFYHWESSRVGNFCASSVDSVRIDVFPIPRVNLGPDTTLCSSSVVLDATNAGATYRWSNTATTPTITVGQSGTYQVTVTQNGQCSVVDSITVVVLQRPTFSQRPTPLTVCRAPVTLNAQATPGTIRWMDINGTVLGIGDSLRYDLVDTVQLFYQATYWEAVAPSVGRGFPTSGGLYFDQDRGIEFEVLDFMRLDRVQIKIDQAPFTAVVVIEDAQGQVLYTQNISFNTTGIQTINLGAALAPSTGYRLLLRNISGGSALLESGLTSWLPYQNTTLRLTRGTPFASVYGYFYHWEISTLSHFCSSSLDSVQIDVLPTPTVNLGVDTMLCSSTLVLNATYPSGIYTWNNNLTTPTIAVSNSGTYAVTVTSNGQCPVTDSIDVVVFQRPNFTQRPSTVAACHEEVPLVAQATLGSIRWLDSSNTVIGVGDTLLYNLVDTVQLYYQAGYYDAVRQAPGADLGAPGSLYVDLDRGIEFEVLDFVRLDAVQIDITQAPFTAKVEIENAQGEKVYQAPLSFSSAGLQTINLGVALAPGTTYIIYLRNISGGQARINNPISNWAVYSTPEVRLIGGAPFSSVYGYFYNWQVSVLSDFCTSLTDSIRLNALPTPTVDFPTDTIVCNDSLFLDVTQPNASYNWTPVGITTGDLTITQEDNYRVVVAIGSCTVEDSIYVYLTPEPNPMVVSTDTSTCVGVIPRVGTGAAVLNWYDAPVGGRLVGQGGAIDYLAQTSDTIWLQGQDFVNKRYTQGLTDTLVAAQSAYFFPTNVQGLAFDAEKDILLESVTVYIDRTSLVGTIALWDANDVPIDSQTFVLTNVGANVIPLNFTIPAGQDYKLVMPRYNVIPVLSELPYNNFPIRGDYVTIQSGFPVASVYQYFYNWQVKTTGCAPPRQPSVVTVLPTPTINFPVDSVICGSNLLFDASSINATTYQWSNGTTNASVFVDSTQTLTLVGAIGNCTDTGTINVFVVEPPSLIVPPRDTVVCQGNLTLRATGNAAYYAWYDSLQATTPFALGDSIRVNATDSSTLWVEGVGFLLHSEPQGEHYEAGQANGVWLRPSTNNFPTRGMDFQIQTPILLNSVDVYADTSMTAVLTLRKGGFPYYQDSVELTNIGRNTLVIDTLLEPGNYQIVLSNVSTGGLYLLFPYGNSRLQQLNTPEITFLGSAPLSNQYTYFFDWRISTPSCATTRLPVRIDVPPSPVLSMVADTANCGATSLVLDPVQDDNPAYAYQWSNGPTSDTLVVTSSGYYQVTVTNNGRCPSIRNTYVQFLTTPTRLALNDVSLCSPETIDLGTASNDGIVVWYDSSDLNQIQYLTAPYTQFVPDTATYWLDVAPRAVTRLGTQAYPDPSENSVYLSFIVANTFDVNQYAIFDSVAIYVDQAPATVDWVIMDSLGNSLYTGTQLIHQAQEKVFLTLDALLPPGRGYQMSFNSISSPFLVDPIATTQTNSSANIARLTGTVFNNVNYNCFFDWHFSYAFPDCHALSDTVTVQVVLPITLADTLFTCDSVQLSVQQPNATSYQWSTGATAPQVTLDVAGMYGVTVTDGGTCTYQDSFELVLPQSVGLPARSVVCGNELSTNYDLTNAQFLWNNGATTPTITLTGPNIYSVTVTTNEGCILVDSVYIAQLIQAPTPQLGGNRTVCFSDTLDAGFGGQGMSYQWSTGAISQRIIVNQTGFYSVTVTHPLGCSGTDGALVTVDTLPEASFNVTINNTFGVFLTNTSTGANLGTTYAWNVGDGTQYSIPSPFHTYGDTGCYTIQLIVNDICGADTTEQRIGIGRPDSSCTIHVHRLPAFKEAGFTIVPNPNNGQFELWLEQPLQEVTQLRFYNSQGQLMADRRLESIGQRQWSFALPELPTGVYILQWTDSRYSSTRRLVIQRE